ncbi:hypothetical protein [Streptomyces sp. NPDC088766]|uniref:hypothetical protein n=1 Tax=Streptomyces sp. NPDC088766 TaxID=3365893 RepID=UPI0037FAE7B1
MRAARHARRRAGRRRLPAGAARQPRTAEPPRIGHDHPGRDADAGLPAVRELP